MESFIRSKYETRRWALEGKPPEDPSVLDTDDPQTAQGATQVQQNIGTESTPVTQPQRAELSHRRSVSDGHHPELSPAKKVDVHALLREPPQRGGFRALPISANDPLPTPQVSIPEPVPMSLDTPPTPDKSEDLICEPLPHPPTPSSRDTKSSTELVPTPEPLPPEPLAVQNPPDHPLPSSEFCTPLGAVGPHDSGDTATTTLYKIGTPLVRLRRSRREY